MFTSFGVFMALLIQFLITSYNSQAELWRLPFGFMILPIFLQIILICFFFLKFESPIFLMKKEKIEECREVLEEIYD